MKLRHLIALGIAGYTGYTAYKIYRNRDQFKKEAAYGDQIAQAIAQDLDSISKNVAIIREQSPKLQELSQDLTYKFRIFSQENQGRIDQIKQTMDKYQMGTKSSSS